MNKKKLSIIENKNWPAWITSDYGKEVNFDVEKYPILILFPFFYRLIFFSLTHSAVCLCVLCIFVLAASWQWKILSCSIFSLAMNAGIVSTQHEKVAFSERKNWQHFTLSILPPNEMSREKISKAIIQWKIQRQLKILTVWYRSKIIFSLVSKISKPFHSFYVNRIFLHSVFFGQTSWK